MLFAICVIKMLPSGEDFDCLGSSTRKAVEQTRVKAFFHIEESGDGS